MLIQLQRLATNLEILARSGTLDRRDFVRFLAATFVGSSILSANKSQLDQRADFSRVLEDNENYSLKFHSQWYQQGDLIIAELEPHVPLQDSTITFHTTRPNGKKRILNLPKLYKDDKIFVFFGVGYDYPAQDATLELRLMQERRSIRKSYSVNIKPLENVREDYLSSATTQNSEPRTPSDNLAVERERNLLYPAWGDYITKLDQITGRFQLPRPVCDFESFSSRRIYDGVERSRHNGVDCKGEIGDVVRAALPGLVVRSRDGFFYTGNAILIKHGFGLYTLYVHLSERNVQEGEVVPSGKEIGKIGATGRVTVPHLHWQAKLYGMNINPKSLEILNDVFH